jgi:hypothetical protein
MGFVMSRRAVMPDEFRELAAYNARVGDGIVHTAEYAARMAVLQARYKEWDENDMRMRGFVQLECGAWVSGPVKCGDRR